MAKRKTPERREWTATDIHKLKGLAKKKAGVDKIARALKRILDDADSARSRSSDAVDLLKAQRR